MREAVEFDRQDPAAVYDMSAKPIGQVRFALRRFSSPSLDRIR